MSSEQKQETTNLSETTQNPSKIKMPKKPNMERKKGKRKEQQGRGGLIEVDPIAGTRDFPPTEMRVRNWLFGQWKRVARAFGFEEYDAPILERVSLYKRKGGDEIVQQMYNFKDKSDLEVTLRPEMTPTLSRLVLQQVI
jgi:histidyl-tRNA synthetase